MKVLLLVVGIISWSLMMTAARFPDPVPAAPAAAEEEAVMALQWPVHGRFLQGFGWGHRGVDIGAAYGTPLGAAAPGWVAETAWENGYGKYVVVDHENGYQTLYSHLADIGVEVGQSVATGDLLGWIGMTGYATTPHVHFEVRLNGWATNPLSFLP